MWTMTKRPSTRHQFEVSVKNVRMRSATEVIEGKLPTSITLPLEPLGNLGTPCELQLGLIGENLNRAIRLQKAGSAIVEVPSDWWGQHRVTWQEEVIDLAPEQFTTIPSGL
jgi:hypothetical protein